MKTRRKTRSIRLGKLFIGSEYPIVLQSMTNTDTRDVEKTLAQIRELEEVGCEIVRLAVIDEDAAQAIKKIRLETKIPLVADIHFDYRLALTCLKNGIDGLRINPGNIGGIREIDTLVSAAKDLGVPIRIGVNSGSVEKDLLEKFGGPTPEAMVESAMRHVGLLENRNFDQIKLSLKSSSVLDTIIAYRLLAEKCDYPLHIGVTEAGPGYRGVVKSSVGLGILLSEGIGDTLRVSLTANPVEELPVAWELLRSLGLRQRGAELISCPTCGRTELGLIELANLVEKYINEQSQAFLSSDLQAFSIFSNMKIAVMGCVVNGPGEAKEADIGIACGRNKVHIFRKGKIFHVLRNEEIKNEIIIGLLKEETALCIKEKKPEIENN
ncbi:flavodoxin-dependent (E)-4-hydroxy-3-methylbut-2-enyl-diphosphate synthase [Desulfovibrio litoralis]|uniref:flavodoxin-dependent (E)-4-hydroxy-3-methylbut-2-enyl-diphosphate synthase n=1 Tax=Desulfovibrio litoralis TaxID=466107 RepID=UPI0015B99233